MKWKRCTTLFSFFDNKKISFLSLSKWNIRVRGKVETFIIKIDIERYFLISFQACVVYEHGWVAVALWDETTGCVRVLGWVMKMSSGDNQMRRDISEHFYCDDEHQKWLCVADQGHFGNFYSSSMQNSSTVNSRHLTVIRRVISIKSWLLVWHWKNRSPLWFINLHVLHPPLHILLSLRQTLPTPWITFFAIFFFFIVLGRIKIYNFIF